MIQCDDCGASVKYEDVIACEGCDILLHIQCVIPVQDDEYPDEEVFYCSECKVKLIKIKGE